MDDIIVPCQTKRQFCQAKKRLQAVLKTLHLTCAPSKTKMGRLPTRFHFLGINFSVNLCPEVPKTQQDIVVKETMTQISSPQFHVEVTLHERCCVRAMDNIKLMGEGTAPPEHAQLSLFNQMGRVVEPYRVEYSS